MINWLMLRYKKDEAVDWIKNEFEKTDKLNIIMITLGIVVTIFLGCN